MSGMTSFLLDMNWMSLYALYYGMGELSTLKRVNMKTHAKVITMKSNQFHASLR